MFRMTTPASALALTAFFVSVGLCSTASAQMELQNDGWLDNTAAGFQGGFVSGEIGASVFQPEQADLPVKLQKVRFLFGGDRAQEMFNVRIKVWDDPGGGTSPSGGLVYDEEFQVTSSTMAFNEVDVSANNLTFNGAFRVGIEFTHDGFPAIARDDDGGNNFPNRNLIMAQGLGWQRSIDLLVQGDWIIRATVQPAGGPDPNPDPNPVPVPDMNPEPTPDMMPDPVPDMGDALVLTTINPTEGSNDKDTDVTILGTGFTQTTTFRVGSTQLTNLLIRSDTSALAVVPAGIVPGVYDVIANDQASGVQSLLSSGFTVTAPPVASTPPDDCSTAVGFHSSWIPLGLLAIGLLSLRRRRRD